MFDLFFLIECEPLVYYQCAIDDHPRSTIFDYFETSSEFIENCLQNGTRVLGWCYSFVLSSFRVFCLIVCYHWFGEFHLFPICIVVCNCNYLSNLVVSKCVSV